MFTRDLTCICREHREARIIGFPVQSGLLAPGTLHTYIRHAANFDMRVKESERKRKIEICEPFILEGEIYNNMPLTLHIKGQLHPKSLLVCVSYLF